MTMRARVLLSIMAAFVGVFVSVPTAAMGQTFAYAQECISNVNNATVHVPAAAEPTLPDGTPVETGDTLAVYTAGGTCAGYGVWGTDGATLAAAGSDSVDVSDDGYAAGDSLKFKVFDVSEGQETTIESGVAYASCDSLGVPVCAEGAYGNGTFHQVSVFEADSASVTRTLTLADGWNFISIPVKTDLSFETLLPECSSGFLYTPENGYISIGSDESIPAGEGAVVQCQADTTSVTGQAPPSTIEVEAGWNLIGSVEDTVAVDAITVSPPGIVESDFFKIAPDGGYQSAAELRPGRAYWVNVAEAGTLEVSGGSAPLASGTETPSKAGDLAEANRLVFVDAQGRQSTLWLKEGLSEEQRSDFELPPVPPGDVFDVRFASGHGAASFSTEGTSGGAAEKHRLQVQGVAFPVEVRLDTDHEGRRFALSAGEKEVTLSDDQSSVQIQQSTGRFAVAAAPNPREFEFGKVYPNPIRTQAELEYALPEEADVSIVVYDLLGRQVARLVDEERETGRYQTQVDAGGLASGKYFVRMQAGSFQKTRQLTVVR